MEKVSSLSPNVNFYFLKNWVEAQGEPQTYRLCLHIFLQHPQLPKKRMKEWAVQYRMIWILSRFILFSMIFNKTNNGS
jgi:hypothetical protein